MRAIVKQSVVKLGRKKELDPGIERILVALVSISSILSKIRETVRPSVPKYRESGEIRPVPLSASQGFANFVGFLWHGS